MASAKFENGLTFLPDYFAESSYRSSSPSASCNTNLNVFPPTSVNMRKPCSNPVGSASESDTDRGKLWLPKFSLSSQNKTKQNKTNQNSEQNEQGEKVKTKLLSMWNNVRYGWTVKMKTNFNRDSPIWFLGHCYHKKMEFSDDVEADSGAGRDSVGLASGLEAFRQDFVSRVWLTYRREFPTLAGSSLTTDCGWGCMLRSGQMMLAQALVHHFLGRGWRWFNQQHPWHDKMHHQIIRWFGDIPNEASPFSLHQLVAIGESSGKKAGDWYGPASVAHILRQAMENATKSSCMLDELCIYVAQDCTVYKEDVVELCTAEFRHKITPNHELNCDSGFSSDEGWRGVIILVPVRLGGETFNSVYVDCIKSLLIQKNCIGIIGGRPKHSLYFVGWQDDKLIHLDPHYCQEMVDVLQPDFSFQSFHCMSPRKMSFSRMDPSCTIGFYCRTKTEFDDFIVISKEVVLTHPQSQRDEYPIFVVSEGHRSSTNTDDDLVYVSHWKSPPRSNTINYEDDDDDDDDEFVVL